jgi:hypothetical protein
MAEQTINVVPTSPIPATAGIVDLLKANLMQLPPLTVLCVIMYYGATTWIEQSKSDRVLFQKVSDDDRSAFKESLKSVQDAADRRVDKTVTVMEKAIEELKRATDRGVVRPLGPG